MKTIRMLFATLLLLGACRQPAAPIHEEADFKALQAKVVELQGQLDALQKQNDELTAKISGSQSLDQEQNSKVLQLGRKLRKLDQTAQELKAASRAAALENTVAVTDDGISKKVQTVDEKVHDLAADLVRRNEALEKQVLKLEAQSKMINSDLENIVKQMPDWMK